MRYSAFGEDPPQSVLQRRQTFFDIALQRFQTLACHRLQLISHLCLTLVVRAVLPARNGHVAAQPSGPRVSALASTSTTRAGLDGENDVIACEQHKTALLRWRSRTRRTRERA